MLRQQCSRRVLPITRAAAASRARHAAVHGARRACKERRADARRVCVRLSKCARAQNAALLAQMHDLQRRYEHKNEELTLLQEGQSMLQQQLRVRHDA